jgi:hypothetical protein
LTLDLTRAGVEKQWTQSCSFRENNMTLFKSSEDAQYFDLEELTAKRGLEDCTGLYERIQAEIAQPRVLKVPDNKK